MTRDHGWVNRYDTSARAASFARQVRSLSLHCFSQNYSFAPNDLICAFDFHCRLDKPIMASAIPSEIVELVLAHIRQDDVSEDTRNLITAMCVCRQWCELGIRVIWADIAITSLTQLGSFVKAPLSTNFSLVRSLSLVLPPCEPKLALDNNGRWYYAEGVCHIFEHGNCRTQELHGHVSRLVDFLPHMINLEAFSFHITGCIGMGHRPNGFFINQDVLRQLLEALPKSLQHLELDTKMYDRSNKSDKSDHLCPTISIISQRLQTLRVRLSQACSAIFGDSQTLNTCVFNLTNPEGVTLVHECANAGVWGLVREVTGHATRRVLIGAAVENSPRCPKLQNLLFTDSTLRSVNQNNSPDVSSLTVRNVLNTTSSAFPLFPVETHNSVANSDRSVLRFKMANGEIEDVIGARKHRTAC